MDKLTKYNSYEALKADINRTNENEQQTLESNLEMKQTLEHLRSKYLAGKEKQKQILKPKVADEQ